MRRRNWDDEKANEELRVFGLKVFFVFLSLGVAVAVLIFSPA